jgi:sigma-B regulation protein RsbU (phosphoserine phosphatase)
LALFWFLYSRFDILAVLTLQLAGGVVLAMFMLAHKGLEIGLPAAALLAVLATAFRINTRGASVSEGDPSATNPALSGFRAEREKLQAEFSVARRAQQGMLPQSAPEIPGYSIAASCTPSLDVGGDLYDFLKLPDGRIGIGVADVSGKGVPAALYMTLTKGLLASVSKDNSELAGVVEEVNRHLHGVTRKKVFVTMALGFLDAEKRVLQCVRAGHNPVVWRQASRDLTTLVAPGGLGLGITASRVFANQLKMVELELSEGDSVVFYSDGITEAMNSSLEQFGEQRLMEAVEKTDRLDAAAAHDSILSTVREFLSGVHPQDDMTLVVLRVGAR